MSDPYHILGLNPGATPQAVKAAYRRLALQYHPDRNPSPDAARQFTQIQRAYEVLSRPEKRRRPYSRANGERPAKPFRPSPPPGDPRKYGTRHKFTNPPPTYAARKARYQKYLKEYSLFTKDGLGMPRALWHERFKELRRESWRSYKWLLGLSLLFFLFGIAIAFTDDRSLFAFNAFLLGGLNLWTVFTDKAPKSLAERKAGKVHP